MARIRKCACVCESACAKVRIHEGVCSRIEVASINLSVSFQHDGLLSLTELHHLSIMSKAFNIILHSIPEL